MDIKESSQLNKSSKIPEATPMAKERRPLKLAEILESAEKPFIRTMQKDMAALQKKGPVVPSKELLKEVKKAAPPAKLPVVEPAKKPVLAPWPPQPSRPVEIPKPVLPKPPIPAKPVFPKRATLFKSVPTKPIPPKKEIKSVIQKRRLKLVLVGLAVILIIGGLGGFLYWWNYLRVIPPVTYYQCQDAQCVSVEGEGIDQCQTDEDCQPVAPVEPIVPEALISIDETKTIELTIGQEGLLLDQLKLAALEEQTQNTFRRILVKLVSQEEKRYMDLETLFSTWGIIRPQGILQAVATSTEAANYTLLSYNQTEGNRLGIIIALKEGVDLVQELRNWEESMRADLNPFFPGIDIEAQPTAIDEFQDNTYQDMAIRYLNFPDPGLSIDYGIVAGKLILTTSRESMYAAIDALLAVESETESEPESESEVENCGLSESLLISSLDQINPEADETLVCLGRNMLNACQKAEAILKTFNAGEIDFILEGQAEEGICNVRIEYGDEEQIPLTEQKQYANTYIKCPVDVDFIKGQALEKDPNEEPGAFALSVYMYIGFEALNPNTECEIGNLD